MLCISKNLFKSSFPSHDPFSLEFPGKINGGKRVRPLKKCLRHKPQPKSPWTIRGRGRSGPSLGGVEEAGGRGGRDHFRGVPGGPRASLFWSWGPWDRHWGRDDLARRCAGRRRPRTASIFREGEERSPSRLCDSQRDEGKAPRPFHAESIEDRERRNRAPDDLVRIFCSPSAS